MNATDRAALASEPVPVDEQGYTGRACVVKEDGVWRTAWLVSTHKSTFGKPYGSAREAAAASRWLNERAQA